MSKKELAAKIVALETHVAMLSAQVAAHHCPTVVRVPVPYVAPTYPYPYTYPTITVSGAASIQTAETVNHYLATNLAAALS